MSTDLAFPKSLPEFQRLFPDDAACARYLSPIERYILLAISRARGQIAS